MQRRRGNCVSGVLEWKQKYIYDDDGNNDILSHIVKAMIDLEVELILVHEINVNSPLNLVMGKIPEELVSDVYKIYEKNAMRPQILLAHF